VLLGVGLAMIALIRWTTVRVWLIPLTLLAPLYIGARVSGLLRTEQVRVVAEQLVSKSRAGSLIYRLRAEDIVFERMAGHWWLGFGDFGLWRQGGGKVMALDGFWLFAMTRTGMLSVAAFLAMVALPILAFAVSHRDTGDDPRSDRMPWVGIAFATFLALSLIDSMLNYFGAAPQMLVLGALAGQACHPRPAQNATKPVTGDHADDPPLPLRGFGGKKGSGTNGIVQGNLRDFRKRRECGERRVEEAARDGH
jgi:hypothetical protein